MSTFRRSLVAPALAALALVPLAACSSSSDDTASTSTTAGSAAGSTSTTAGGTPGTVVEKRAGTDPAEPVVGKVGDQLDIVVESNPSTGYTWSITTEPDAAVATFAGSTPPKPGSMPGAAGLETFTFDAVGPGTTTVTLTYARSFAPDDNPTVETFTLEVTG